MNPLLHGPRVLLRIALYIVLYVYALGAFTASADVQLYPLVTYVHLSDPTAAPKNEVSADYIGGGVGLEWPRGIVVEVTLGAKTIGCVARDCGRSTAALAVVSWRGRHR